MKRTFSLSLFAVLFMGLFSTQLISFSGGPPGGRTGSPGDNGLTCNSSGCHNSFDLNSGSGLRSITSDIPAEGYTPGQTYTLNFIIKQTGINRFGFEGTVYSPSSMGFVGDLLVTDATRTRNFTDFGKQYVSHTVQGIDGNTDSTSWSVDWEAPAAGTGDVEVYAAFNATNNNSSPSGDNIYTSMLSVSEASATNIEDEVSQRLKWFQQDQTLHFSLEMNNMGDLQWQILGLDGKQVYSQHAYSQSRKYTSSLDVSKLSEGVYILSIKTSDRLLNQKIVVR